MSAKPSARLRSSTRASTAASESWAETKAETKTETKSKGGDSRRPTSSIAKPMRGTELRRIARIATAAYLFSIVFVAGAYYMIMSDKIQLYPSSLKVDALKGFGSRMEYALRYQSVLFFWLVFNIHAVIYARLAHKAINPLVETTEKHVQMHKNILTNSFEQIVSSAFLQLIFVSFAEHSHTMRLIPAINLIQFIGRIAFFLGYPHYRTLGISLTLNPNIALACFNLYKLGSYLNVY